MGNWDEDYKDENLEESPPQAMEGQIGIEELYIREDENAQENQEPVYVEPIDGQMTFEEYQASKGYEFKNDANTGDIEINEDISLKRDEHLENLNDFFVDNTKNEKAEENINTNEKEKTSENFEEENDRQALDDFFKTEEDEEEVAKEDKDENLFNNFENKNVYSKNEEVDIEGYNITNQD